MTYKIGLYADIVSKVLHAVKKVKKDGKRVEKFSASMVDIDEILNVKPKKKKKTIIPEQYWGYIYIFDENNVTSLCYRCVGRNQRERPTDRPSKR